MLRPVSPNSWNCDFADHADTASGCHEERARRLGTLRKSAKSAKSLFHLLMLTSHSTLERHALLIPKRFPSHSHSHSRGYCSIHESSPFCHHPSGSVRWRGQISFSVSAS
jgi:hypothetical protein